jgi:TetR/AcrR family transcriptional repressor of multidrug resistance operon
LTINECSFNLEIVRHKDDNKNRAICDAAIELITKNGFADTSMSKIAKAAGVSPATIYVYFENKEDLLNKLYLFVKREMSTELLRGVKPEQSTEEAFKIIWHNFYNFAVENPVRFAFTEQFANSPMVANCRMESMDFFKPLIDLFEGGKRAKIFKDVSLEIFHAFTFSPLMGLIKEHLSGQIVLDQKALAIAYEIAWDAVTN